MSVGEEDPEERGVENQTREIGSLEQRRGALTAVGSWSGGDSGNGGKEAGGWGG